MSGRIMHTQWPCFMDVSYFLTTPRARYSIMPAARHPTPCQRKRVLAVTTIAQGASHRNRSPDSCIPCAHTSNILRLKSRASSSAERSHFGCFASGRAEAQCQQDEKDEKYKYVVVTFDGESERTAHMLLAGLGLVWYLASGLVAAPSAFFTRRESRAVF